MQKKLSVVAATAYCSVCPVAVYSFRQIRRDQRTGQQRNYTRRRKKKWKANYERHQLFERLESNYPFGTYAAQAQMEIAYAYYKAQDQAQALAAVERFIKLHPNHPNVDYMYYLRGLVNFNDQIGFKLHLRAGPDRARPEGDPRSVRRLQGTGRQVPEQQIRAGRSTA
jgi:outer membrane protein assembly factor BamD